MTPQLVCREDVLTLRTNLGNDDLEAAYQVESVHELDLLPYVEVTTDAQDVTVTADLDALRTKPTYSPDAERRLFSFLSPVSKLLPFRSKDDAVFGVTTIGYSGLSANVYPSLQTWLQSGGMDQDVSNECRQAMLKNMGHKPDSRPQRDSGFMGAAAGTRVSTFRLCQFERTETEFIEKTAGVLLVIPSFQTIGNCACMGSNASDRHIYESDDDAWAELYKIETHNVDSLHQVMSLLVGIGTLASHVSIEYDETEIFRDISWNTHTVPRYEN